MVRRQGHGGALRRQVGHAGAMPYDAQRQLIRTLARASREFDRARDALMREPDPRDTRAGRAASPQPAARGGLAGAVSAAARTAGGAARAAGRAVAGVHPRHTDWHTAILTDRIGWWVKRFGTAAAALTAVPGLLGKLGRLTGIGDVIGAAAQVLIVNAVAREMGIADVPRRVAAVADIVLGRQLTPDEIAAALAARDDADDADDADETEDEARAAEERAEDKSLRKRLGRSAGLIWRVARDLWRLNSDMDKRAGAGAVVGFMRNLPAVGAVSAFAYERKGIARAAEQARTRFGG